MAQSGVSNKAVLDLIFAIKNRLDGKVDGIAFPIPQFIVVGKQSVGKSRLIEALAGETFNFVCGSLGSRRPTILEFRNSPINQWHVFDDSSQQWKKYDVKQVMEIVGKAHNSLGEDISEIPVKVKLESPDAVDLGIVDLPGFRAYSSDAGKAKLAKKIDDLNMKFMKDNNNHMLCVEEAGDNAGFSTLAKCKGVDPQYRRTYLIRNKFDKFYGDLTAENINKWVDGYGDLPAQLDRFALSLPHWGDGLNMPKPFRDMRKDSSTNDLSTAQSKGCSEKFLKYISFQNFQNFIEVTTQKIFREHLGPMKTRLRDMHDSSETRLASIKKGIVSTDDSNILHETRSTGITFAQSFNYLMEGALSSEKNRMTMEDELEAFHRHCDKTGCLSEDQRKVNGKDLKQYLAYLRDGVKLAGMDVQLNGGAQFRRLMIEVEVYIRFAGLNASFSKSDIIRAKGHDSSWEETIMKIVQSSCPNEMIGKTKYVGERLKWFFSEQKEATVDFMATLKGSPEEHMYSKLISQKAENIVNNPTMKDTIFRAYDNACEVNMSAFDAMWEDYMNAMFQSPLKLLKSCTMPNVHGDDEDEDGLAPTFDTTKDRIAKELDMRDGASTSIRQKIKQIPDSPSQSDEARDMCRSIVEDIFARIRTVVADQMQLYSESFFLLPMLRRLEGSMSTLELPDSDRKKYEFMKKKFLAEEDEKKDLVDNIKWCIDEVTKFEGMVKSPSSQ